VPRISLYFSLSLKRLAIPSRKTAGYKSFSPLWPCSPTLLSDGDREDRREF